MNDLGKLPPQDTKIEQKVLGSLLLEKDAIINVADLLKPEMFYKDEYKIIYRCISDMFNDSKQIDLLTVADYLRNRKELEQIGGIYELSELTNNVGSSENIESHARIIVEKYMLREIISLSTQLSTKAYDNTDPFDLLSESEKLLENINNSVGSEDLTDSVDVLNTAISELERITEIAENDGLRGVPSGFLDLDRVTFGWLNQDLNIIAARPGMGKTSFMLALARNSAFEFNSNTAIFSLEMSKVQLLNRLISIESEIELKQILSGKIENYKKLNESLSSFIRGKLFIDDTSSISPFEIKAKLRRLKRKHNIKLCVIDYIQLMSLREKTNNREQEISTISRQLKCIAKELDIPIIVLSQLNRDVEKRSNKRPQLSDLRESGAIEQDADRVMFIYRPEYYGNNSEDEGEDIDQLAEIIIAKNRHGSLETINLYFWDKYTKFSDVKLSLPF